MIKNKIFIFEYVSGGGFNQIDIPSSLFSEGYGMLKSIIDDFKNLDFEVITLLDKRISFLGVFLEADFIELVNSKDNYLQKFKLAVKKCHSSFIIAPEFSNILYNLTKIVKDNNKKVLSIDLKGIEQGSSKIKTYEFFTASNVKTPRTFTIPLNNGSLNVDFIIQKFNDLSSPIVIKPNDGVGGELIYYFDKEIEISNFFNQKNNIIGSNRSFILQEYIEGEDLSISLIGLSNSLKISKKNPIILSINTQDINIKKPHSETEYFGGYTPIIDTGDQISNILQKLNLTNFNGYFGIDFVKKADDSVYFIEINPRLTTSYIGIRNVINYNPAVLILNPNLLFSESEKIIYKKNSIFSRIELKYVGNKNFKQLQQEIVPSLLKEIPEIVTPPISLFKENNNYSCFIATKEKDLESSRKRFNKIMIIFEEYNFKKIK